MRLLVRLNLLFAFILVLHTADHVVRQHRPQPGELSVVGIAGMLGALLALGLALLRHPRAPLAAAVVGLSSAVGFVAVHVAPHWSALSDPYPGLGLDGVSWTSMLAGALAGLALGIAGVRELAGRRGRPQRPLGQPARQS